MFLAFAVHVCEAGIFCVVLRPVWQSLGGTASRVPSQSFRVARQRCNSEHLQSFKSQTAKGTHHLMDERARQLFPSMKRQLSEDAMLAAGLENSPETQTTYGSTSAA